MADETIENSEVYNHYLELSKPTEADFKRVFTDNELKELCLKHKCRVDMWRWNVANDYRILFMEKGRYQRWSERDRLRMLTKAVNKMKPSVLYNEQEMEKTRKEEWGLQLKENILSLNFWERKRRREEDVLSQCAVNTESMNVAELQTHTQSQQYATENTPVYREFDQGVQLQVEVNTESMNENEMQTQEKEPPLENIRTSRVLTPATPTQSDKANIFLGEVETEEVFSDDSEDSTDTVIINDPELHEVVGILQSEEVAPEIENIYGVNTMSMTIDSEMCTQSQNLPLLQSEEVIPASYDNFKNIIPLTSTQSQSQESEEIKAS